MAPVIFFQHGLDNTLFIELHQHCDNHLYVFRLHLAIYIVHLQMTCTAKIACYFTMKLGKY